MSENWVSKIAQLLMVTKKYQTCLIFQRWQKISTDWGELDNITVTVSHTHLKREGQ